jgi:DNA-binding CsgD family transcriptional regulator
MQRTRFSCARCGHLSTQHKADGTCAWCAPGVCDQPVAPITDREFDVLKLLASGQGLTGTARKLNLSVHTVDAHKYNMVKKTGMNTVELIVAALRGGVLQIDDLPNKGIIARERQ